MKKIELFILVAILCYNISAQPYWGKTSTIGKDGVMEIGKYIDFHESSNHNDDYSLRLLSKEGILTTLGSQHIVGSLLLDDPNYTDNWNNIWQSGFFQAIDAPNSPESGQWFWGLNLGHSSNNPTYRYGGQLLIKNSSTVPTMYFRSINKNGDGLWAKVIHNYGNQVINGNLIVNGVEVNGPHHVKGAQLIDAPNYTDNWNNIWQSGFFQAIDAPNAPENGQWFWGLNLGHSSNNPTYRYGGQLLIKNSSTVPTMYFRSIDKNGDGIWAKVVHSNGNQIIDGRLTTKEIVVKQDVWSDFVFEPEYNLPTLEEVEEHIKEHKHLPDVPNEAEVKENGLSLGESNAVLLQKIEELTLYLIEQDKKQKELVGNLEAQQEEIQKLNNKINQLEK